MVFDWRDQSVWTMLQTVASSNSGIRSFISKIDYFVAYHGCRTTDVLSYYGNGLLIANHSKLTDRANQIFVCNTFPQVRESDIQERISEMGGIDNHTTYAVLDKNHFLKDAAHYLIYGSEFIVGVAAGLTCRYGIDYRQHLKTIGVPTVFKLSIPVEYIRLSDIDELATMLCCRLKDDWHGLDTAPLFDFSFTFKRNLPPECFVAHEHPAKLIDPLMGYTEYKVDRTTDY